MCDHFRGYTCWSECLLSSTKFRPSCETLETLKRSCLTQGTLSKSLLQHAMDFSCGFLELKTEFDANPLIRQIFENLHKHKTRCYASTDISPLTAPTVPKLLKVAGTNAFRAPNGGRSWRFWFGWVIEILGYFGYHVVLLTY